MKKVLSIIIALATMTAVQAANTEVARLTLTGQGSASLSYVTLRVDPAVTVAETGSYFENTDLPENVNIYVKSGSDKYSSYKLNDLTNLAIAIVTNRKPAGDQHYTLTFNVPTLTEGLKITDLRTGTTKNITNGDTFEFDVNTTTDPSFVAGTNFRIEDRFVINYVAPTLDVCFKDNHIEVVNNPFSDVNITLERVDGTDFPGTKSFVGTTTDIDMTNDTNYPAGRYYVKFAGGNRKFIIVKP